MPHYGYAGDLGPILEGPFIYGAGRSVSPVSTSPHQNFKPDQLGSVRKAVADRNRVPEEYSYANSSLVPLESTR